MIDFDTDDLWEINDYYIDDEEEENDETNND